MKDGQTHLAHKAEQAVDLESGALVAVTVQGADQGDTRTLVTTAITAAEQVEAAHATTDARGRLWRTSSRTRALTATKRWSTWLRWACGRTFRNPTLAHAQTLIEAWRCEYNEERPKKGLGGLTPALYAKQLAAESSTVTPGL